MSETPETPCTVKVIDKDMIKSVLVFGGTAYFMLPIVNDFSNRFLKTNYNSRLKTENSLFGYKLSRGDMKIMGLLYSYMFSNSALKALQIDSIINQQTNQHVKTFLGSFFSMLVYDITLSEGETYTSKAIDAMVLSLLMTVSVGLTDKAKISGVFDF